MGSTTSRHQIDLLKIESDTNDLIQKLTSSDLAIDDYIASQLFTALKIYSKEIKNNSGATELVTKCKSLLNTAIDVLERKTTTEDSRAFVHKNETKEKIHEYVKSKSAQLSRGTIQNYQEEIYELTAKTRQSQGVCKKDKKLSKAIAVLFLELFIKASPRNSQIVKSGGFENIDPSVEFESTNIEEALLAHLQKAEELLRKLDSSDKEKLQESYLLSQSINVALSNLCHNEKVIPESDPITMEPSYTTPELNFRNLEIDGGVLSKFAKNVENSEDRTGEEEQVKSE